MNSKRGFDLGCALGILSCFTPGDWVSATWKEVEGGEIDIAQVTKATSDHFWCSKFYRVFSGRVVESRMEQLESPNNEKYQMRNKRHETKWHLITQEEVDHLRTIKGFNSEISASGK